MKKRIISAILSAVFLTVFVLPCLSGCNQPEDENHYTVLQWLEKVEENFNLLYYSEQEPLVKSVSASDEGFDLIQTAAEWGIINVEDDISFSSLLTKELAADTLIRAMNCVTPSTADISDSGDVKALYLENVMSSVNEGIFGLAAGKFEPKKQLTIEEADAAILKAHDKWVNFSYGGVSFDKSTIKENVINLGGIASENSVFVPVMGYSVEYTGSKKFFDENGGYTDNTSKTITFPAGQVPAGLATDMILAMPADDIIPMNYAVVVTGVTENSDGSVTVTTRNAELHEVYEEIDIQQSGTLDFSNAVFYGPDGQRLFFDNDNSSSNAAAAMLGSVAGAKANVGQQSYYSDCSNAVMMLSSPVEPEVGYLSNYTKNLDSSASKTTTFKLSDELSVTLRCSLGDGGGGIGVTIKGEIKEGGEKLSAEFGFDETVKVENRIKTHWDWFKLKVDELKLSVTDTKTETFGFSCSAVENFGSIQNKVNERGDGWDIGDWAKEAHKLRKIYGDTKSVGESFKSLSAKAKAASNKKLFDVIIAGNLHFVVRAELTVEGSLKLTLTQSNTSGVEYLNGNLRPIHEKSNSQKLDWSAKVELTFRVALEFQLIGINVADVGLRAGIGAKVNSIIYSFDKSSDALLEVCGIEGAAVKPGGSINASEDVQIAETGLQIQTDDTRTTKICSEIKVYPILSVFGCSSSSVAGSLFGTIELTILGENNPIVTIHSDDGVIVSECTVSANDNYGILTGDKLTLNMNEYAIAVSEEADTGLAVVTVPNGVTIKDISITSDNTEVLEVDNLLQKITTFEPSSVKPELKITGKIPNKLSKTLGGDGKGFSHKFGSWFYQDAAESAKPQFALTGKKNGVANVTITAGGQSVTVPVQVGTGEDKSVSTGALIGSKGTFTLAPGETAQTAFDFIPEEKTIADIVFASADNDVATVSSGGLITAVREGDTVITATLMGEEKEYTTKFTVHVIDQSNIDTVSVTFIPYHTEEMIEYQI